MRREDVGQPAARRLWAAGHLPALVARGEGLVHALERAEVPAEHADGGVEVGALPRVRAGEQPPQVELGLEVRELEVEQRLGIGRCLQPEPQLREQVALLLSPPSAFSVSPPCRQVELKKWWKRMKFRKGSEPEQRLGKL